MLVLFFLVFWKTKEDNHNSASSEQLGPLTGPADEKEGSAMVQIIHRHVVQMIYRHCL